MSRFVWLAMTAFLGWSSPAPQSHEPETRKPAGRVSGRVAAAESGRPIAQARVTLRDARRRVDRAVLTDADGHFTFNRLPAGSYLVTAEAERFITGTFGEQRAAPGGRFISLAAGATFDKANFALPRTGVIYGRVVDEAGEPLDNVRVYPMKMSHVAGAPRLSPVRYDALPTNDLGEFKLSGLGPGDYYIVACPGEIGPSITARRNQVPGYVPTFHPGAADRSGAEVIQLGASELKDAGSIRGVRSRVAALRGVLLDPGLKPIPRAPVLLSPGAHVEAGLTAQATTDAAGAFQFTNLAPGVYHLQSGPTDEEGFAAATAIVEGDVSDFVLRARPSASFRGRIVFDLTPGTRPPSAEKIRIEAVPVDFARSPLFGRASVQVSSGFELSIASVWGPHVLRLEGAPEGIALESVTAGSEDFTDRALDFDARSGAVPITIKLTSKTAKLSGGVFEKDAPLQNVPVVVFPDDTTSWSEWSRHVRRTWTDEAGRFEIAGLPSGRYLAVALATLPEVDWYSPELLNAAREHAVPVNLKESGVASGIRLRPWRPFSQGRDRHNSTRGKARKRSTRRGLVVRQNASSLVLTGCRVTSSRAGTGFTA